LYARCRLAPRVRSSAFGACLLCALLLASVTAAEPQGQDTSRESYSIGHQIGMDVVRQSRHVDLDALLRGLQDGLAGHESAVPAAELDAVLLALKQGIVAAERSDRIGGAPTLRRASEAFMAENAQREGVVALPSGVQYRIIRPGSGPRPSAYDSVEVRYRSTRLDGTAFHDSTRPGSQPETLRVGELIAGLREVLPLMSVGARWEIFIPPQLAFGRRGPLADHAVVYELELLGVRASGAAVEEKHE
jgi:FKBP-type peptidyl-prolyl cis-trans isomerase